ncbi:MAG: WG repeat-containing protein [Cyclobacteriaceae bacterium]|nr:WG repeat-containing protein [Cyclobacteriaceae bacterium]
MLMINALVMSTAYSQETILPKAIKLIQKNKNDVAQKYLEKLVEKDSVNPEYYYSFSIIYLTDSLSVYNVDTSYQHINTAITQLNSIDDSKILDKLNKDGIDSIALINHKTKIESAAFAESQNKNTEDGYNYFLSFYTHNNWSDSAVVLRNIVAYQSALKENTYSSYRKFMKTYPNANEVKQALVRFERLYFDETTKDNKLSSYIDLLKKYPKTSYREIAEEQILKLSTLTSSNNSFMKFIASYPKSKWVKTATNYIFHLNRSKLPSHLLTDSLNNVNEVDNKLIFPFYKFGLYGFISDQGSEFIAPKYSQISDEYTCNVANDDFLLISKEDTKAIENKLGHKIWIGNYDQVSDLGSGILSIKNGRNTTIIHKSGLEILSGLFDNIKLVNGHFLAVEQNKKWGLYSLLGYPILKTEFQEIEGISEYIILTKNDSYAITNADHLTQVSEGGFLRFNYIYTDYELLKSNNLYVENNGIANIINPNLEYMLPLTIQELEFIPSGIMVKQNNINMFYSYDFQLITENQFYKYAYNKTDVFIKNSMQWQKLNEELLYDSVIIFSNNISMGVRLDSNTFFLQKNRLHKSVEEKFRIIRDNGYHHDKEEYLVFTYDDFINVYNLRGKEIFKGEVEKISALGPNLIVIQQSGKKGVIDSEGNTIVPMTMDAIANYNNGSFAMLSDSKFGIYSKDSVSIAPEYSRALKEYSRDFFIAYKDDYYGLINKMNESVTNFEFEEIRYWNDTSALVKQNFQWKIYDWNRKKVIIQNIKGFEDLSNKNDEIISKMLIEDNYGIYSNKRGTIIPVSYSDILDIGTNDQSIYLAERNIEGADFYVTIYYNSMGEIIHKHAYEAKDYQKILCDME